MDPSIFLSMPAAGAHVQPNFTASGAVSVGYGATVKLWNGTNSYGPFNATVAPIGGSWNYHFQNIAPGSGYTLQACIPNTTICVSHSGITVDG